MESGDDLEQEIEDAMTLEALIRATQVEIKKYLSRLPIEAREQSALVGNALEAISGYSVTAANYPIVIEVLKNRFGIPTVIIERHVLALVQMERCESASAQQLRKLHGTFVQHVWALAALRKDPLKGQLSTANILMAICKQKLPTPVRKRWEGKLTENGQQEDDLNALLRYIESCLEIEGCLIEGSARERRKEKNSYNRNGQQTTASALQASVVDVQNCVFCHGSHKIVECNDFTATNVKSTWRFAKSSQLCFICLQAGHSADNCKERKTGNKECHELLRVRVAKAFCNSLIGLQIVLAKAHGPIGFSCKVTCLLDAGSQRTFIRKDLADRLGLRGPQENVVITTIGDRRAQRMVKRAKIWLSPLDANACDNFAPIRVAGLCLPKIYSKVSANQLLREEWTHLQHLKLANRFPRDEAEIDVLIGLDQHYEFIGSEHLRGREDEPVAVRSVFGCIVYGKMAGTDKRSAVVLHVSVKESVREEITTFLELESIGMKYKEPQENKSQVFAERLKDTVSYNGERYVVRLPWKTKNPNLPNSCEYAVSSLGQTENRLKKEKLKQTYSAAIKMYVANGWAEEILDNVEHWGKTYYLPYHAVYREEKVTTQRRIVFDASACYEGQSLNSMLAPGPSLESDSFGILFRLRRFRIGLQADISKMFLQVALHENHQDACRYVWRDKAEEIAPRKFRFKRICFGLNCSPFLAMGVVRQHVEQYRRSHERVVDHLLHDMYVDDIAVS
uniref:DUF1758 domain-containing protein n=1 Tax=Trichuris muris TaxID=70415 RepID=A0A5S6Q6S2_TRIMR